MKVKNVNYNFGFKQKACTERKWPKRSMSIIHSSDYSESPRMHGCHIKKQAIQELSSRQ